MLRPHRRKMAQFVRSLQNVREKRNAFSAEFERPMRSSGIKIMMLQCITVFEHIESKEVASF